MTDDAIPDETTETDADEQPSWVMIATTCGACGGSGQCWVEGIDIRLMKSAIHPASCQQCGGTGRELRRERRERSGGNA